MRNGRNWAESVTTVRVVGTGVMGRGIAQLAAGAGLRVELADARPDAVGEATDHVERMLHRSAEKGRTTPEAARAAVERLVPLSGPLDPADDCDLVIEAVQEDLDVKRELFGRLEELCPPGTVLATNTSSLPVTDIAAGMADPSRLVGTHFFNPVPLMRLVEIIPGARTAEWLPDAVAALVRRFGHEPVRASDTPGFLVNHAGRGLNTEALQILAERLAEPWDVDRIARESLGLRMGPFELMDLTGLDVTHPVLESIWSGFHAEPRLRPSHITANRLAGGLLGRKSDAGFYRYDDGAKQEPTEPALPREQDRPVWIDPAEPRAGMRLAELLRGAGADVATGPAPPEEAVVLVTPYDRSALDAAYDGGLPLERTCGVDPLGEFAGRLTLAAHPGLDPGAGRAALAALAATGSAVSIVRDAPGSIAQRLLASIVNTACGIAEQHLATPEDIDLGVRLGLGYPRGPLEWGEHTGSELLERVLRGLRDSTGDPRYRPSRWLTERARLGLPLNAAGTAPGDLR